jgi:S-DNA-T family DNA segregation ATPase FtsK/SpoIIIE
VAARKKKHSRSPFAVAFDGHGHDVWGIVFVLAGLVSALGIYFDNAGALGSAIDDLTGWFLGLLRVFVPVGLVLAGYRLMRGRGAHARESESVGTTAGAFITLASLAAFSHLFGGRPTLDQGAKALGGAGGIFGLAIGEPLRSVASIYGAVLILLAVGLIGGVLFTGIPTAVALEWLAGIGRATRDSFVDAMRSLFQVGEDERASTRTRRRRKAEDDDGEDGEDEFFEVVRPVASLDDDLGDAGIEGSEEDEDDEVDVEVAGENDDPDGEYDDEEYEEYDEDAEDGEYDDEEYDEEAGDDEDDESAATAPAAARKAGVVGAGDIAWKLPPLSLLKRSSGREVDRTAVRDRGRLLERALAEHGVQTRLVGMVVGPTVTRYELELGPGVKVARVTSLNRDIAYAMASPDVRILAPIPGRQAIGVEVPNEQREIVAVGDILASPEAKSASHPLEVAVGRDINGKSVLVNLATMPHLLIAGATGAGKSSCINSLITSILMRSTPDQVRMILIDPKMVEMSQYERIPHLLTAVVTDPKKAANALAWAVREMDRRYELLSQCGFRDINGYNAAFDKGELQAELGEVDDDGEPKQYQRLSYILVVVDELADLMMVAARDVEDHICRIAQKARAVGIHLVIATQRPSVNVITGLIKANVPARLAFAVSSQTDSRVILDQPGAERLVGKGDMLLQTPASSMPNRIQGSWVSEEEVRSVVAVWRRQMAAAPAIDSNVVRDGDDEPGSGAATAGHGGGGGGGGLGGPFATQLTIDITDDVVADFNGGDDDGDDLLFQAMELVVSSQLGSTSMLQRKLRVGFARAGRIMDLLEQRGVVGPSEGSKARAVLMTPEELEELKSTRR